MKRTSLSVALLLSALASGCNTADDFADAAFAILYSIEATGGATTVTQVQYLDGSGSLVTEMNPALPWTMSVSFSAGESALLGVTGSTGAGSSITATIQDDPAVVTTPTTYATETCAENVDPCEISLSNTF
jgi:hypothetical protein